MEIAEIIKNIPKEKIYYQTDLGVLICADSLEILSLIPDNSVDLVLTDPPYNASNSKIEFADKHYKSINEKWDIGFKPTFLNYINPKQLLVFCSYHTLNLYLDKMPQQVLHWIKNNPVPSISGKTYIYSVEYILWYVFKRPYAFNSEKQENNYFFDNTVIGKERTDHPTQKPIKLIINLIKTHSNANNLILDPFFGSGTTGVACEKLNRRWIGIEISEKYCEIAKKRIGQEANQLKLFK